METTIDAAKCARNVRFGSKADIGAYAADVRFTPESRHAEQTFIRALSFQLRLQIVDEFASRIWVCIASSSPQRFLD